MPPRRNGVARATPHAIRWLSERCGATARSAGSRLCGGGGAGNPAMIDIAAAIAGSVEVGNNRPPRATVESGVTGDYNFGQSEIIGVGKMTN